MDGEFSTGSLYCVTEEGIKLCYLMIVDLCVMKDLSTTYMVLQQQTVGLPLSGFRHFH